jgi:tRNA (adenine57-N1/adenine58-N1)-methyltransferase
VLILKKGEVILLLSKESSYLIEVKKGELHTKDGIFKLDEILKKKFGDKIKTHLGKEFIIVKPTINDILEKKIKRTAQVILPKDAALILAQTGISSDSLVIDFGTGSAYLAIFLANYLSKGKVVTYEKNKEFAKIASENIKASGLKNIKLKRKDVSKGVEERNADLVTIDLQHPEKFIKLAYRVLKLGGWLAVYSPTIEEMLKVKKEIKKFNFLQPVAVENIVREWKLKKTTRPKTMGIMHTGFLIFARKIY